MKISRKTQNNLGDKMWDIITEIANIKRIVRISKDNFMANKHIDDI